MNTFIAAETAIAAVKQNQSSGRELVLQFLIY